MIKTRGRPHAQPGVWNPRELDPVYSSLFMLTAKKTSTILMRGEYGMCLHVIMSSSKIGYSAPPRQLLMSIEIVGSRQTLNFGIDLDKANPYVR